MSTMRRPLGTGPNPAVEVPQEERRPVRGGTVAERAAEARPDTGRPAAPEPVAGRRNLGEGPS